MKRNDELETSNSDLKKYLDSYLHAHKPTAANPQPPVRKSTSKSRGKKGSGTPRSPLQGNRILRSYNAISQIPPQGHLGKGFLNKTLKPTVGQKKSILQTHQGINCSMNDISNKNIANCMINNLYFIPKTLKAKQAKRKSLSKLHSAHEPSINRLETTHHRLVLNRSNLATNSSGGQGPPPVKLIDQLFHHSDNKTDSLKLRTSSIS